MDRTTGTGYITVGGKRKFTDGPPATIVGADFMNQLQEELVGAIEAAGLLPSALNSGQLIQAIPILATKYTVTTVVASTGFGTVYDASVNDSMIVVTGTGYAKITLPSLPASAAGKVITIYNYSAAKVTVVGFSTMGRKFLTRTFGQHCSQYVFYPTQWMDLAQMQRGMIKGLSLNTWVARTNPKNLGLNAICYSDTLDLWVAVGVAGAASGAYIVTSPDGVNWTERGNPSNVALNGVCWSRELGLFVAVGNSGSAGADAYIITSSDGTTWNEKTNPSNVALNAVCWASAEMITGSSLGSGMFVAVGAAASAGADSYILTSVDGNTWVERAATVNVALYGVSQSDSTLVAVGAANAGSGLMLVSYDGGATWAQSATPSNVDLRAVCWGGTSTMCAVGATGSAGTDSYIVQGSSLTSERVSPKNLQLNGVCWDGDCYIAVGATGAASGAFLVTSSGYQGDFIERPTPSNFQLNGVASNGKMTIAVGAATGSAGYIITSVNLH